MRLLGRPDRLLHHLGRRGPAERADQEQVLTGWKHGL